MTNEDTTHILTEERAKIGIAMSRKRSSESLTVKRDEYYDLVKGKAIQDAKAEILAWFVKAGTIAGSIFTLLTWFGVNQMVATRVEAILPTLMEKRAAALDEKIAMADATVRRLEAVTESASRLQSDAARYRAEQRDTLAKLVALPRPTNDDIKSIARRTYNEFKMEQFATSLSGLGAANAPFSTLIDSSGGFFSANAAPQQPLAGTIGGPLSTALSISTLQALATGSTSLGIASEPEGGLSAWKIATTAIGLHRQSVALPDTEPPPPTSGLLGY